MKIIGQTGDHYHNDFIMLVPEDEAYNLIGHYSSYGVSSKLKVGDTIKVHEMYDRLKHMEGMRSELEKAAAILKAAAELVNQALPAVHRANKTEQKE